MPGVRIASIGFASVRLADSSHRPKTRTRRQV
jgi:hypothetical protein